MAARVWTVTLGNGVPVAGTGPVTDGATDTGSGFMIVATRDVTIGTKKDIIEGLQKIIRYMLSEQSSSPGQ